MRRSFVAPALLLLAAAGLAACAPAAPPRATVTIAAVTQATPERPAPRGPDALVWIVTEDGKLSTRWIASTADGYRRVAEAPDLLLAVGPEVWRWSAREEKVATIGCEDLNGMPPGEGNGMRAALEKLGGGDRLEVVAPVKDMGANQIEQSAVPAGSIGPYLFVREQTYAFGCGAHGSVGVTQAVWDLSHRAEVDLLDPGEHGAVDSSGRASAQRLLSPEGEESVPIEEISYVASVPRYLSHGWLSVEHAYTTFACYACSDGAWSSYTRSVHVPAPQVPARARAYVRPPAAVTAYLDDHPAVKISGWSPVSTEAAGVLRATIGGD